MSWPFSFAAEHKPIKRTHCHCELLDMSFLIIIAKLFASLILVASLIVGAFKANPRTHRYDHRAEYLTGFIFFIGALAGLYYLWV